MTFGISRDYGRLLSHFRMDNAFFGYEHIMADLFVAFFIFLFVKLLVDQQNFVNESITMNWAMGLVAPFTLFPATAAMFSVTRKWIMGDTDVKLLRTFFKSYKDNYKQAMVGGIFYTLLFAIMYIDYYVYMTELKSMQFIGYAMLGLLILLFVSLFNFFSMVAHLQAKTTHIMKNSVLLTIFTPVSSVVTIVLSCIILYFSLTKWPVLLFFFSGSLIAYLSYFNFNNAFQKIQDKYQRMVAAQEGDGEEAEVKDKVEASESGKSGEQQSEDNSFTR
ncbi:hypothetical protein PAV_3c01250 [Paenibacillus alvei DSM 29]|uniref:YesL family protein n=1 Tax=Paenibacillus alvei TaxID=44250 RepID=UPI000287A870|nr:hypothetical protein PAV_3c01250 [Paenibacillus alvei DSM 29]